MVNPVSGANPANFHGAPIDPLEKVLEDLAAMKACLASGGSITSKMLENFNTDAQALCNTEASKFPAFAKDFTMNKIQIMQNLDGSQGCTMDPETQIQTLADEIT
jgi:hypothetical protein